MTTTAAVLTLAFAALPVRGRQQRRMGRGPVLGQL